MPDILPLSLVVTTRNEEANVPEFYQSLAASSVFPAELVICDAGSHDRTVELLGTLLPAGIRLDVFVVPGATIAAGRNRAIERCTQGIIVTTDMGCRLDTRWLERISAPLLTDPTVDVVSGGYVEEGRTLFERLAAASSIPVSALDSGAFLPSSRSFALRRGAFDAAGGYPEDLSFAGEDTALCLRLRALGFRFAHRVDAFVTWYPRATLRSFFHQHRLYGIGDGESRMRDAFYRRIAFKWLFALAGVAAVAMLLPLTGCPGVLVAPPLAVAVYYRRLAPKYAWRHLPVAHRAAAFALVAVKEFALFVGWLQGHRPRGMKP